KETNQEQYSVKLIHLLKYAYLKQGFTLPDCITTDSTFQTLCGISELAKTGRALVMLSDSTVSTASLSALQSEYLTQVTASSRDSVRQLLEAQLTYQASAFEGKRQGDSIRLDSIYTALTAISCSDVLVQKWVDVYKVYTKFLRCDTVALADRDALTLLSK